MDALPESVVRVRRLERRFGDRRVLDGVDLDVGPGEFVALIGRSGCGKSTLLRALAGLDREATGSGDIAVPERVGVVFQDARLLPWKRIIDNVTLGLSRASARQHGERALAEVGLATRCNSWPFELSGGEQQRVALARVLVREPALLLADEPFGALDALTRLRMHGLLRHIAALHSPAVLLITHDVDEAIALADRVVVLQGGRISAQIAVGPRVRARPGAEIVSLRRHLLALLGVEEAPPAPTDRLPITQTHRSARHPDRSGHSPAVPFTWRSRP